ncbi:hypothetical protein FA13DRAFT_1772509 [Coprinellus micaceus]|uniref:Uncharacterized protein n=1 Tax=Coprinellus micaceus TaxID=71717 RepID=A0A4Y7TM70_COPMI|nr:hypothetical protein FA13DRAFT_1772509 [Coprinellus micaceus]
MAQIPFGLALALATQFPALVPRKGQGISLETSGPSSTATHHITDAGGAHIAFKRPCWWWLAKPAIGHVACKKEEGEWVVPQPDLKGLESRWAADPRQVEMVVQGRGTNTPFLQRSVLGREFHEVRLVRRVWFQEELKRRGRREKNGATNVGCELRNAQGGRPYIIGACGRR